MEGEMNMIKKLLLVIITALMMVSLVACNKVEIKLKKESFTFEYGETIPTKADDYLAKDTDKSIVKDTIITIDGLEKEEDVIDVGSYKATASYKNVQKEFTVTVEDTVSPEFIDFKDTLKTTVGNADFDVASNYEAVDPVGKDKIPATISVDGNVDVKKAGSYKVTITAKDKNNNSVSKDVTIIVEEKKVTTSSTGSQQSSSNKGNDSSSGNASSSVPSTPPSSGGSGSSSNNSSNGSNSSGNSSGSSSEPQVCTPNGEWKMLSNSGFACYDYEEAYEYSLNNMPDNHGAAIITTHDICGNEGWTVYWYELTE